MLIRGYLAKHPWNSAIRPAIRITHQNIKEKSNKDLIQYGIFLLLSPFPFSRFSFSSKQNGCYSKKERNLDRKLFQAEPIINQERRGKLDKPNFNMWHLFFDIGLPYVHLKKKIS